MIPAAKDALSAQRPRRSLRCKDMRTDREEALEAGRRWYARRGRPASWYEWEHVEPGRPSSKTISRRWGWHAFWAEVTGIPAGFTVGERSRRLHDSPRTPLQRLLETGATEPEKIADLVRLYTAVSPLTLKLSIDRQLQAMPSDHSSIPARRWMVAAHA